MTIADYIFNILLTFIIICIIGWCYSYIIEKSDIIEAKLDSLLQEKEIIYVIDNNMPDTVTITDIYNKEYLLINKK